MHIYSGLDGIKVTNERNEMIDIRGKLLSGNITEVQIDPPFKKEVISPENDVALVRIHNIELDCTLLWGAQVVVDVGKDVKGAERCLLIGHGLKEDKLYPKRLDFVKVGESVLAQIQDEKVHFYDFGDSGNGLICEIKQKWK
uniref:Peptidase_S24 domain-containing protein n=1 Tax=Rhabditophanes sp. KR3021 TaxID=114890 RepID=A0AC35U7T5_9BILA